MTTSEVPANTDVRLRRAVRAEVLEHGLSRTTMTSLASRAALSRMTAYRRAGSVERVVLDALTEDVEAISLPADRDVTPESIALAAADIVHMLIGNPLFQALQEERPELLASYTVERLGGVQQLMLRRVRALIEEGQRQAFVRAGDPDRLAFTLLIAIQGFALMREPVPDLSEAVHDLVVRYLKVDPT